MISEHGSPPTTLLTISGVCGIGLWSRCRAKSWPKYPVSIGRKSMGWRHYEVRQSGDCEVLRDGEPSLVRFDIGIVETGRTRAFAGHFVRLSLTDGRQITGEDERSLRAALWRLARNVTPLWLNINCVGLNAEFTESGLSVDTGWGYWGPHSEPMHMMDPLPEREEEHDLDRLIKEAVHGMEISIKLTLRSAPGQLAHAAPRKAGQGRAAPPSGHRAPFASRGPAYSEKSAPRTPR